MSEFAFEPNEMLRPLGEVYDGLRQRASEVLGRVGMRMGFGEAAIACSTENSELGNDKTTAEMAEEEEEKKDDDNGDGNGGSGEQSGHDSSKCTATVCSACGKGGGGNYFSAVPRKRK